MSTMGGIMVCGEAENKRELAALFWNICSANISEKYSLQAYNTV